MKGQAMFTTEVKRLAGKGSYKGEQLHSRIIDAIRAVSAANVLVRNVKKTYLHAHLKVIEAQERLEELRQVEAYQQREEFKVKIEKVARERRKFENRRVNPRGRR